MKAAEIYAAQMIKMQELVNQIQEEIDNHFDASPEDVNYGHVGSMDRKIQLMMELLNK